MKISGFLVVNKPEGITSFDVIRKLRFITGIRKMGHAGTLDPFASGVLIIGIGHYTRLLGKIGSLKKEYKARAHLGISTDTADLTGKTISTGPVPEYVDNRLLEESVLKITQQLPPRYSALKINGQPAYSLARKNRDFDLSLRNISIAEFEIFNYDPPYLTYRAIVSKGTYIRTLTEQIAEILGTKGTTTNLIRTAIDNIDLTEATDLDKITADNWRTKLKQASIILPDFQKISLPKNSLEDFFHGRRFQISSEDCLDIIVLDENSNCIGLADIVDAILKPKVVFK